MSSIFQNVKTDREFSASTGLTQSQFSDLVIKYIETEYGYASPPEEGSAGYGRSEERLFMVLYYLKTYLSFDLMGIHFDISRSEAERRIKSGLSILKRTLNRLGELPLDSQSEMEDLKRMLKENETLLIDTTERRVERPKDQKAQKAAYSGKKNPIRRKIR